MAKKKTLPSEIITSEAYIKDFFDMVVPSTIKFNVDHFVCGDSFRCVWAIKEYPPSTTAQAILSRFGDKEAVTLHIYTRFVDELEQRKILQNASRKNKMLASSNDLEDSVIGEGNLCDVVELMSDLRKNREPLLHCAVFIELSANIAKEMHISPNNLRWYAAYHNAEEHPHVHMLVWSKRPQEPYLSTVGIENIKKDIASDIFRQDNISIYIDISCTKE